MSGNPNDYVGRYGEDEDPGMAVVAADGVLAVRLPGTPADFDAPLVPAEAGPDRFRIAEGPLAGLPVSFARDESGAISGIDVGGFLRLDRRPAGTWPDYLFVPQIHFSDDCAATFDALWEAALRRGDGRAIDFDAPYARHHFLCYLVERKGVVLHGSNDPNINQFEPRRRSVDGSVAGNRRAVYACADGIWPLYFAVVDRKRYRGSLRNGAFPIESRLGDRGRAYYFSLNRDELSRAPGPWIAGMVYILPAATFQQTATTPVMPLEVASDVPVRPLARLPVLPQDFPFLQRVHGHDDTISMRAQDIERRLYAECLEAVPLEDGYALRYDWSPGWAAALMEYIDIMRWGNPWRRFELRVEPDRGPIWLSMRGSESLRDVIEAGLAREE